MGRSESEQSASTEASADEVGVYKRADVEGFAQWARATIARLQAEVAELTQRADAAERRAEVSEAALADREGLQGVVSQALAMVRQAVDEASRSAAEAAADAAAERVAAVLDEVRSKAAAAIDARLHAAPADRGRSDSDVFDDPVRDPLPPWGERLLAFPDEPAELPPIGPIFETDTHRSA